LKYRVKKDNETWNQYIIKIFRDGKHVRYPDFLDEYFKSEERLKEYKEGIKQDALDKENKIKKTKKNKVEVDETKTTFSKKPDRLKKKKKEQGFLF